MIRELKHYWNVGAQYREFARREPLPDARGEILRRRERAREVFLALAKEAVFEQPENPYHALFRRAGCGYEDLAAMVERDGIDRTLRALFAAGVRLTHAEFKGHAPIARDGVEIVCEPTQFSNPWIKSGIVGSSSGSRSRGTPVRRGVEWLRQREAMTRYQYEAVGLAGHRHVGLLPMLPALSGISRTSIAARAGTAEAWFSLGGTVGDSWHYRTVSWLLAGWMRVNGVGAAMPRFLTGDDFGPAAEYVARLNAAGVKCVVDAIVSPAVRLADAARARGLDLSGTTFLLAGEALTNAKRAVIAATGAVALFANLANFAPMAKGGSIRGVLQRGPGGGPTGFSPFLFLCCQGNSINDSAYLLGLSDDDPHRIVLRKGAVTVGLPNADGPGVLLKSAASFAQATWVHLRLDVIVNTNGDVVLKVFQNDLAAHALGTPPDWQPVSGMVEFIDDHLGINSGWQPLTSGRGGFGFSVKDVTRRAYFDHLELFRQV